MQVTTKWAEPKPGHEAQYRQAIIDRHEASLEMLSIGWLGRLFQWRRYNAIFDRWGDAVDRMKIHGRDVTRTL